MKTEHILIIRFSAMGDVAMLVPVVSSLAKQYPEIRITVLSRPFARPLFSNLAENVGFMAADIKKEYNGVHGLNKLYRRLAAKNFTAIADMHNVLRSNYLRLRFNLDRFRVEHIDKHRDGKRKLCQHQNKVKVQQPTSFQNYADVLYRLGYPIKIEFTSIFPPEGGDLSLLPTAIGMKHDDEQWIGVAPFAAHQGKMYPLSKIKEAVNMLSMQNTHRRFFFFGGGSEEKQKIDEIIADNPHCTNASSVLGSLEKELILMSHLNVMISMDSANMHLASITGTPVVSIWGATHPFAGFMGWNQPDSNAVQVDLDCRPCSVYGNRKCWRGDLACLNEIEPGMIVRKVNEVINK